MENKKKQEARQGRPVPARGAESGRKANSEAAGVRRSSLLRHPVFGRTFAAYGISVFGDWFDVIAIQVLIGYRWQASPLEIALVPVCMALPGMLLGTAAGTAADRWNRLALMRLCDVLTALATLGILFVPNLYGLFPLLALRAALGVFNVPAQQALTRRVVDEERLIDASSLNGLASQLSRIAGPLAGAAVLALLSPQACMLINAGARLLSYGILKTVPREADRGPEPAGQAKGKGGSNFRREWREGWALIRRTPPLLRAMTFALCGMLVVQMIDFQFISLFRAIAPDRETAIGWLLAASGVSAAAAAAANMRFGPLRRSGYGLKLGGSYVLIGLSILLLGLLPTGASTAALLGLGLLLGAGNGLFMVTFNHALQTQTPANMTGRVFGIQGTLLSAVMLAAPPLGGLLVQRFGPGPVFAAAGLSILLLGAAGFAFGRAFWKTTPAK